MCRLVCNNSLIQDANGSRQAGRMGWRLVCWHQLKTSSTTLPSIQQTTSRDHQDWGHKPKDWQRAILLGIDVRQVANRESPLTHKAGVKDSPNWPSDASNPAPAGGGEGLGGGGGLRGSWNNHEGRLWKNIRTSPGVRFYCLTTSGRVNLQALNQALTLITGAMRTTPIKDRDKTTSNQPLQERRETKIRLKKFRCQGKNPHETESGGTDKQWPQPRQFCPWVQET